MSKSAEVELLVNRLTEKPKEAAKSIRIQNPGDAVRATTLVWERLDDKYCKPEMVEESLRSQLENSRYMNTNEYSRRYDLHNILINFESLKASQQFAANLAIHDTSFGVNPILSKCRGTSVEDRQFLALMDEYYKMDEKGHWTAPLPFREDT